MNYFALEFIVGSRSEVHRAFNDMLQIMQATHGIMPSFYHDTVSHSLVLVWHYKRHTNDQAWDVCHHIPQVLFNDNRRAFVNFCHQYQTSPIVFGSEPCWRMLRFGNPHAFTCFGEIPWSLSDAEVLHEVEWNPRTFAASVKELQASMVTMVQSFAEAETGKPDFSIIYMMYKKLEAMAITTDSMESVQPCLHLLNALFTEER